MANLSDETLARTIKTFLDDPVVSDLFRAHCGIPSEEKPRKVSRKRLSRKSGKTVPASPSPSPSPSRSPSKSPARASSRPKSRTSDPSKSPERSSRSRSRCKSRSRSRSRTCSKSRSRSNSTTKARSSSRSQSPRGEKPKNPTKTQSRSRTRSPVGPSSSQSHGKRSPIRTVKENSRSLSRSASKRARSDSSETDEDSRPRLRGKQSKDSPKYKIPRTKLRVRPQTKEPAALLRESHRILFNKDIKMPEFDIDKLVSIGSNISQMPCGYFQFGKCKLKNIMAHQEKDSKGRLLVHACSLCFRLKKIMFPHNLLECPFASVDLK